MSTLLTPDICVIGAGSGGLTVAAAAASFGVSVVLIERGRMGGDCLNYGCVPSKALIAAAGRAHVAAEAPAFGIEMTAAVDFGRVHDHIHEVIATIAPHDSVERFESLGVRVLKAEARFQDARTVVAGDHVIRARRFVVATGSRPAVPPIDGLAETPYLTNETVFDLTRLQPRLVIIGGGAIGAELAQAFRRLGSDVTVLERDRFLAKEDPELVAVVRASLTADGVRLREGVEVRRVRHDAAHGFAVTIAAAAAAAGGASEETLAADEVIVATGRTAVFHELDLDKAGIASTPAGITVDEGLRTSNRRVYAIGDCTGREQFTHVAGYHAGLAVRSILFRLPIKLRPEMIPRVTYTAPELAQIGLTEDEARARHGDRVVVTHGRLDGNDRAVAERARDGLVKLMATRSGKLVGAGIAAPHAGEMLAPYVLAMKAKISIKTFAGAVFPYPTLAEAGKAAAVAFYKPKLTSGWVKLMVRAFRKLG